MLAAFVVRFGTFTEHFRPKYHLQVSYPDAGGVVKGSEVRLGGAPVGRVRDKPVLRDDYTGVTIPLEVYEEFQIPKSSKFRISVEGLLGDAYISIEPPMEEAKEFVAPGETIVGHVGGGLGGLASTAEDLSKKGELLIDDVRDTLKNLNQTLRKIDEGLLAEENLGNFKSALKNLTASLERLNEDFLGEENSESLKKTLANLDKTTENLSTASEKLPKFLDDGSALFAKADPALEALKAAAEDAEKAIAKLDSGPGLLPALLNDSDLKGNLTQFAENLRRSGILRYKDEEPVEASQKTRRGILRKRN